MNNKKVLTNSAILTAIWDETKKDNLELIKPFVEFLIGESYREGEKIDNNYIIKQMDERFSFVQFPETILLKVYGRLKNIVVRKDNCYFLKKNISGVCQKFKERQIKLEEESGKVIESLIEYLKGVNSKYKDISEHETINMFTMFLEKTGYITIENVKEFETKENYKKDQNNFFIAKFIIEQFEKETVISKYIERIISGFMLANAIYMQVESDNKETLKKVDIYLDAPLLLNILNFKTASKNESGNLLMTLLKEKKANVYCFEHNYDEVYSILENYKNNIHKVREKTLEKLDIDRYTESDIERLMSNLKIMLNNKGIQIIETPEYVKTGDRYIGIIDEGQLTDYLMENYADNREKIEGVVERDVKSIAAIGRIRQDKKYKKIEDCKAVFVTTNYNLVEYTERFLEQKKYEEIGFLITDVELITVLWLKSFKTNPDLPKMRLIENARASLELTSTMMKTVKNVIEKMEKEGIINQADMVSGNIQELNYYKREIMEQIDGDEENINEETILGIINKENMNLMQELQNEREKNRIITEEKEKAKKDMQNIIKTDEENSRKKAKLIVTILKRCYLIFSFIILIAVLVGSVYVIYTKNLSVDKITSIIIIGFLIEVLGILDCFVPKYSKLKEYIFNKIDLLEEILYLHFMDKKKKEYPQLYK